MRDLYIIVEGETELEFVNRILIPYLYSKGVTSHIQAMAIYMSGGGHGFNNIQHLINTIYPVMNYGSEPIITTLIDYFKLNSERKLPGFTESLRYALIDDRLNFLEDKMKEIITSKNNYRFFIPYIQKHEIETLLFANPTDGFSLEGNNIINSVLQICQQYQDIEDINGSENGAPSKRLDAIYKANGKKYVKNIDGIDIAELTGIEKIIEKCPRFRTWVEKIDYALNSW